MFDVVDLLAFHVFDMGWPRIVGALKSQVSFAKEPYKRDYILQKRPISFRSLPIVAVRYHELACYMFACYMFNIVHLLAFLCSTSWICLLSYVEYLEFASFSLC